MHNNMLLESFLKYTGIIHICMPILAQEIKQRKLFFESSCLKLKCLYTFQLNYNLDSYEY